ncbi:PqqD family protein [Sphingobacterium composti Ten et al. 2007 non Yoo et al. 2007]|uniref:PqqD family protein n=1 Tax=Sphingobacterium composti TaxID=363260 RepID=UPI001F338B78|nr:PqqD family protein [Sphingobacterium composti Ten et al. 2007 non Yoo et al. 2007]
MRKVGDDYVIVAPEQGMVDLSKVYSLNETAAWLWDELDGKDFVVSDMVELVRNQYDVEDIDDTQLIHDMQELIEFFKVNDLLLTE